MITEMCKETRHKIAHEQRTVLKKNSFKELQKYDILMHILVHLVLLRYFMVLMSTIILTCADYIARMDCGKWGKMHKTEDFQKIKESVIFSLYEQMLIFTRNLCFNSEYTLHQWHYFTNDVWFWVCLFNSALKCPVLYKKHLFALIFDFFTC